MGRLPRVRSKNGLYHVMARGNNKKSIYFEKEDYETFIEILYWSSKKKSFSVYAYCLMPNHYHLLIFENKYNISQAMKSVNTAYAVFFNKKYDQLGHLFQDRYKSEAIEDENYLLAAIRYIHNNPLRANLVTAIEQYPWCSYPAYLGKSILQYEPADTEFVLNMFSSSSSTSPLQAFQKFSMEPAYEAVHGSSLYDNEDPASKKAITSSKEANNFIENYYKNNNLTRQSLKSKENMSYRLELIQYLLKNSNLSIRKIASLLDLDKNSVSKIKKLQ